MASKSEPFRSTEHQRIADRACMVSIPPATNRVGSSARPGADWRRVAPLPTAGRALDHMGMAVPLYYTAAMVRALPDDGNRYETVHGELLVIPAPRVTHQSVLVELLARLHGYLRDKREWRVLTSPADISWGPDILVQPDIFVAAGAQVGTRKWESIRTLALVV